MANTDNKVGAAAADANNSLSGLSAKMTTRVDQIRADLSDAGTMAAQSGHHPFAERVVASKANITLTH